MKAATPIEEAIAAVDRWIDDLNRERDRASRLKSELLALRDEPALILEEWLRRELPTAILQLLPARVRRKLA